MEPAKSFNNVIIGQFVLTGVPVKVYIGGRYLTITNADDVEDPTFGFGMDENGNMQRFDYRNVMQLSVSGNVVDLETYNKGMEAKFSGDGEDKEAPKEDEEKEDEEKDDKEKDDDPFKEELIMNLGNLLNEITKDEQDAESSAIDSEEKAAKEKFKAAQAAMKGKLKSLKDREKSNKAQQVTEDHQQYTFGTGDIVKNKNTSCPHHGSMGIVQKMLDVPLKGMVAVYSVTNSGPTYSPGDVLVKTVDQLEPIQIPDGLKGDM